jgi:glutamate--cysteine ligase
VGLGLEPGPLHERVVHSPRYDAMEQYFDESGAAGRTMMRGTAAIQVNLAFTDTADVERQWRVAHDLGPMLVAAFANSPFGDDGPTGWRSSRLAIWWKIDPGRTRPAAGEVGTRCGPAFTDYALAARVMSVRTSDNAHEAQLAPLTFTDWMEDGHALGWPTAEDLEYHLTTLFPPVRPRGWLELRMIDALPDPWWRVASAVTAVLVQDPALAEPVAHVVDRARGRWIEAARDGLSDPELGAAARELFAAALAHLPAAGADAKTIGATEEYIDRYVSRGECPADFLIGEWHTRGRTMPLPDNCANHEWS